jgi:thiamine-monophosphate kinase
MKETEFGYIKWIQKHLKYRSDVIIGSGDDCAVIKLPDDNLLYATIDTIIEGIDFLSDTPAEKIGYKSVAVSLSDLAAMGGGFERRYALISVALPKKFRKPSFTHNLFKGMHRICKRFGVQIIGGDLSATRGHLTITSTLLAVRNKLAPATRSGVSVGDAILVTDRLGGSILGKHLSFMPRLEEAKILTERYKITSMIDISDGLLQDLRHILEAGKVGATLDEVSIPISQDAEKLSRQDRKSSLYHALTDGEDFELLFTAPLEEAMEIIKDKELKNTPISIIGLAQKPKGIRLCTRQGQITRLTPTGFRHF